MGQGVREKFKCREGKEKWLIEEGGKGEMSISVAPIYPYTCTQENQ